MDRKSYQYLKPICQHCRHPVDVGTEPLPPGSIVLHEACNRLAHEKAIRKLHRFRPPHQQPKAT